MGIFSSISRMLVGRLKKTTQQAKQTITEQAKVQPKKTMDEVAGRLPKLGRGVVIGQIWGGKKPSQLKLACMISGYTVFDRKLWGKHRSQEMQRRRKQGK